MQDNNNAVILYEEFGQTICWLVIIDEGEAVTILSLLSTHHFAAGAVKDAGQIHQVRDRI